MGKTSNALIGFMAGAAAGALVGILYAPDKGSKTRDKYGKKARKISSDVSGTLSEQLDSLKKHINDFVDDVKDKFEDLEVEVKAKADKQQVTVDAGVNKGASGPTK